MNTEKQVEIWNDAEVESEVKGQADEILAKQKALGVVQKWGTAENAFCIANVALGLGLPEGMKKTFVKMLLHKGLGGNASQFRADLVKQGKLAKNAAEAITEY